MTYKASDLYNDIKGGTQRANAWAGFLQEEIEEDRKINLPIERAYDVTDALIVNGILRNVNKHK